MVRVRWVLWVAAAALAVSVAGCGKSRMSREPEGPPREAASDSGVIRWDNVQNGGDKKKKMAASVLGVDKAPLIDKAVLSRGIFAVRQKDRIKIFGLDGQLRAQGSFASPTSPVEILGFSPEGDHLFYGMWRYPTDPGGSPLRIIDFSRGTDEAVFSAGDGYSPVEVMFHPKLPLIYVVFQGPGDASKVYRAGWAGGRLEGFTDVTPRHPILAFCGSLRYLAITADGSRVFFDTCSPEAYTYEELPEAYRPKPPTVKKGDQLLYMDPDGRQVNTVSLGLPGFICSNPLPSPVEDVVAVECRRFPGDTDRGVYLVRFAGGRDPLVEQVAALAPGERMWPRLWSADGRYVVGFDESSPEIPVLDVRTQELKKLRPPQGWKFATELQWETGTGYHLYALMSPEGKSSLDRPRRRLVRVDVVSGGTEQVLPDDIDYAWTRTTAPQQRLPR